MSALDLFESRERFPDLDRRPDRGLDPVSALNLRFGDGAAEDTYQVWDVEAWHGECEHPGWELDPCEENGRHGLLITLGVGPSNARHVVRWSALDGLLYEASQ